MKIALVRPNAFDNNLVITPHLGLGYISSYLKKCGHKTKLFDGLRDNLTNNDILKDVYEYKPDFVGITATTSLYPQAAMLAVQLKAVFPVAIGGVHASVLPEETLHETGATWVVKGDGEYSFRNIVNGGEAPGLVIGKPITDLNDIPWPDWEEIDLPKYPRAPWGGVSKRWPIGYILTTRGCPFGCKFCAGARHALRFRDPIDVVEEIDYLIRLWGIKELNVIDDNATAKKEHMVAICNEILRRGIIIAWGMENGIRADRVDKELLTLMKRAGCYRVAIGVENPNNEILRNANKAETVEQIETAIRLAHKVGLETRGCLIAGLPGETKETLKYTAEWARKMPLDEINCSLLDVLPGSEYWTELNGHYTPNWHKKSFKDVEYIPEGLTKQDLIEGQQHIFRRFFSTPKRAWRVISRLRPKQLKSFWQRLMDFRILK